MNDVYLTIHRCTLMVLCTPWALTTWAQEPAGEHEEADHKRHEVGILLGHTNLSQGLNAEGKRTWLSLPSWGVNYNYWINERWAVGLHTDIITETFLVESHSGKEGEKTLERTRPVAPAVMASFRPHEHWSFILGAGEEFASEGNLTLMRAGSEFTLHLGTGWETAASLAYDFRFDAYDSWTFAFGVTRSF